LLTEYIVSATSVLVDIVIVLVVLETLYLFATSRTRGKALQWLTAANSAAGLCLLLALRFAINDTGPGFIILAMTGALLAHLADLRLRHQVLPWGTGRDNNKSESTQTN
jgi:hypothetical protein